VAPLTEGAPSLPNDFMKEPSHEHTQTAFGELYRIIQTLRGPGGCPWDREQSPESLRGALIEETYECIEAIDTKDTAHIREELGDLFLLVTMIAYMHEQDGAFSVAETLEEIGAKLVRRHPHVFSESTARTSAEVLDQWARIKVEQEGRAPKNSLLDEVSRALPPLERAYKLQKKAAKVGFDWPQLEGVWEKIHEEEEEVRAAMAQHGQIPSSEQQSHLEEELGDLLFAVINLCRYVQVDPSVALQRANIKFTERFKAVERGMKALGLPMGQEHLATMDRLWNEAKG